MPEDGAAQIGRRRPDHRQRTLQGVIRPVQVGIEVDGQEDGVFVAGVEPRRRRQSAVELLVDLPRRTVFEGALGQRGQRFGRKHAGFQQRARLLHGQARAERLPRRVRVDGGERMDQERATALVFRPRSAGAELVAIRFGQRTGAIPVRRERRRVPDTARETGLDGAQARRVRSGGNHPGHHLRKQTAHRGLDRGGVLAAQGFAHGLADQRGQVFGLLRVQLVAVVGHELEAMPGRGAASPLVWSRSQGGCPALAFTCTRFAYDQARSAPTCWGHDPDRCL